MTAKDTSPDTDEALVRVDAVLGRATEDDWPGRLRGARVDVLHLDQAEAQKSRLRKTTEGGVDVAVTLDRGTQLSDGDVLLWDKARGTALVVRVDLTDVLVIELGGLLGEPQEEALITCVEVGHALGNQHWPVVIKGTRMHVPLTVDRAVMAAVMKTHGFNALTYAFVPGADVAAYLAPREARLLFGAGRPAHEHLGGLREH